MIVSFYEVMSNHRASANAKQMPGNIENSSSLPELRSLKKRAQFLRVARGKRVGSTSFSLQMAKGKINIKDGTKSIGLGYTVTKKTGNSPERNRIKRRLRAVVGICAERFCPQHDYVLIGRRNALGQTFPKLISELEKSLRNIHSLKPRRN